MRVISEFPLVLLINFCSYCRDYNKINNYYLKAPSNATPPRPKRSLTLFSASLSKKLIVCNI